ncbi:methylated-DNA--[protein]-cysteine S-methyltransferase [Chlorobium sp. N1]|uniref:methylated-DNA--[protein]-cysteine S-methyltransferase n=1 Tax=Chlorobium sp. N1 TaxID=2491138 RepID=UPI00103C38C2|nr:methylated-DNA--[protein]-cysteine S-methyltransferase [Chlorobium sp. N1]TCD47119.1 methylated-DNA--[protein]-cysteine S-methyltransferase [Chlorobium sp. N1]
MHLFFRNLPIGTVGLLEEDGLLRRLFFEGQPRFPDAVLSMTPLLRLAFEELEACFQGELAAFSVPLAPPATAFDGAVRSALLAIPRGETATYGVLARAIGKPGAARAVGSACRRNPLPLFIPCHRVVPASGMPGEYSGGRDLKARLLRLERYAGC